MANKLILNNGDQSVTVGFDAEVIGSNATETVVVSAGADVSFAAGDSDRVEVAGNLADYTVTANGANGLTLTHTDGSVVTLSGLTTTGATVAFADGSAPVAVNLDTTAGTLTPTLGGVDVALDGTALDNTAVTLDATDGSTGGTTDPVTGQTFALTNATNGETIVGTTGSDTYTGTKDSIDAADKLVDASTTDSDTANLTDDGDLDALSLTNIENVNVTINNNAAAATQDVDAANFTGVQNLTITKGDVVIGGTTIQGNKNIQVANLNADDVAKVTTGAGTKAVEVKQTTKAGATIDASTATGNVTVIGAATIMADNVAGAGSTVAIAGIDGSATGASTENAKAVVVDAAKALEVQVNNGTNAGAFTGSITVNAAEATKVSVASAAGGATVNAAKAADSTGTGIVISGIDDTGATVVTGTYADKTKAGKVNVDGTTGTTDVATVSAAGYIDLATNQTQQVDNLNLSGNGAAVTYTVTGAPVTTTLTGDQDITLKANESSFDGKTITDSTTAGTTTLALTTVDDSDLSGAAVDNIQVAATATSKTLTLATGANLEVAADQTTGFSVAGKTADATINLSTGDDTNASGAVIDVSVAAFNAATNVKTLNLNATTGKFTATGTTLASTATLNIAGTKDVTLGTVVAKDVSASNFTGKLDLTSVVTATINAGSGNDTLVLNDGGSTTTKFTVDAGNGNNDVTITDAKAATAVTAGSGEDSVAINADGDFIVVTGAGNDTVTIGHNVESNAIMIAGDGTGDKLVLADTDGNDFSSETAFAFSGFETVDISALSGGSITVSNSQFNGQTLTLKGDAVADNLIIKGGDTADTINASTITVDTASVTLSGGKGNDIITGTAAADTIVFDFGADTIDAGVGADVLDASTGIAGAKAVSTSDAVAGVVVNLGTTNISEATIQAASGMFLGGTATEVVGGSANLGYTADKTANTSEVDSLVNVTSVVGTAGNDYIVASSAGSTIMGGVGADTIVAGAGVDTIQFQGVANNGLDTVILSQTDGTAINDVLDFKATHTADTFAVTVSDVAVLAGDVTSAIDVNADAGVSAANVLVFNHSSGYAADATALAALTTVLESDGSNTALADGKYLVVYAADANSDARIAEVTVGTKDISAATDLVTLTGVTIAEAATGLSDGSFVFV